MSKRGFKVVEDKHKEYGTKVKAHGTEVLLHPPTISPTRSDAGSAGYDFYIPVDIKIEPRSQTVVWTNVKAYMEPDEVLLIFVRSSIGIKRGVTLANGTGVIDASYFNNPSNDGNIGLCLKNNTGQTVEFKAGEKVAQGIFTKFLVADEDVTMSDERTGGIGSSDK